MKSLYRRVAIIAILFLLPLSYVNAQYTIDVKLYSNEWSEVTWGTVSGNEGTFANGSVVTVTVTPIDGKEVREWWVGDVVARNTNTCDIVVNGNTEVWVIMGDVTIRHNLTVNVLPAEYAAYCSVSGAGIGVVLDGSSPTLTASSSSPYAIDHWEIDGVRVAGNATNYTLSPVHSDVTVDAYFTYFPQQRTITVASNNLSRGTVQIEDAEHNTSTTSLTIRERDQLTLTATPTSGDYRFAGWFYNDELVSGDAVYTFNLPDNAGNRTYTANFVSATDSYTMTANYVPSEAASTKTPNPSTSIQVGNEFTFNTTAAANWVFDGWYDESENLVSSTNSYTISYVIRNRTLTAKFHHEPYTIAATANPATAGTISISGANGLGTYDDGTSPVLTASANTGYRFVNWTGDFSSTANPYTISNISRNYSNIVANFVATHTITLTNATLTSATPAAHDGRYDEGTTYTVTANTRAGYVFSHWTVNGVEDPSATANPYTGTLTADVTLEPVYTPVFSVALYKNPADAVVTLTGAGNYENGQNVTVEATYDPAAYNFTSWTIAGTSTVVSTDNPYTFTISGNTELTAQLEARTRYYSVTTAIDGDGSLRSDQLTTVPGTTSGIAEHSTVVIYYDEVPGWHFQNWVITRNGSTSTETGASCRIEDITSDVTVRAVFRATTNHRLTVNTNPAGDPNIHVVPADAAGEYSDGETIELYAHSTNPRYTFVAWMSGATIIGINQRLSFTITSDTVVTASFFVAENTDMRDYLTYDNPETRTVVTGVVDDYRGRITNVTIPSTVTAIAAGAFRNCTSLTSIDIPAGVTSIGNYAFDGCTALTSITLHDGITSLGTYVFNNCSALTSVALPSTLTAIPEGLFHDCSALTNVDIPAAVTAIGSYAFSGCRSIYNLEVPASVLTVGTQAFAGMTGLHFVTLNAGNTSFGSDCFSGSNNIVLTSFNGALADWLAIDFANANAQPMSRSRNLSLNGTILTDLVIPDGVVEIKPFAFFYDTLIATITLPASVTTIDSNAFYRLTNLQRIVLNALPATVDDAAFQAVNKQAVVVEVPCADYVAGMTWQGFTNVTATGMPVLTLEQRPGGMVTIIDAPTCSSIAQTYTISATPGAYNIFQSWSDGNTDNPRTMTLTEDVTLSPIWGRSPSASEVMAQYFTFNAPEDIASWYSPSTGANQWVIGSAAHFNATGKGLYISNDNGTTNSYEAASNADVYTELNFSEGLYRISFNYRVAGESDDYLTVGLIKEDGSYIDLEPNTPGMVTIADNLYDHDSWGYKERIVRIDEAGWYRLAFLWSADDDDIVNAPAAAIDNVSIIYTDSRSLATQVATVTVNSNDVNMGYAYTGTAAQVYGEHTTTAQYFHDSDIQIHAVARDAQHRFVRWSDGSTEADRTLDFLDILGVDPVLTAYFETIPVNFTVNVTIEEGAIDAATQFGVKNGNNIDRTASVAFGATATVVLNQPQAGWAFMGWWDGNDTISTDNPFVYTCPDVTSGETTITLTALMQPWRDCSGEEDPEFYAPSPSIFDYHGREIDNVVVSNVNVTVEQGQIVVSESAGIEVKLFDINGRLLATQADPSQPVRFDVPASGSYMVKVGDLLTRKVVVIR